MDIEILLIGVIIGIIVSAVAFMLLYRRSIRQAVERWKSAELSRELEKALARQRYVLKGKISEQLVPLLSTAIGNMSDARFVGDPVDYVVFDGLSAEGSQQVSVRFLEVKTGDSKLNEHEKLVKEAILNKRVEWDEIRL